MRLLSRNMALTAILSDQLENKGRNYKRELTNWQLSPLDRKVLAGAVNVTGDGAFSDAVDHSWKDYKFFCKLWRESRHEKRSRSGQ